MRMVSDSIKKYMRVKGVKPKYPKKISKSWATAPWSELNGVRCPLSMSTASQGQIFFCWVGGKINILNASTPSDVAGSVPPSTCKVLTAGAFFCPLHHSFGLLIFLGLSPPPLLFTPSPLRLSKFGIDFTIKTGVCSLLMIWRWRVPEGGRLQDSPMAAPLGSLTRRSTLLPS